MGGLPICHLCGTSLFIDWSGGRCTNYASAATRDYLHWQAIYCSGSLGIFSGLFDAKGGQIAAHFGS